MLEDTNSLGGAHLKTSQMRRRKTDLRPLNQRFTSYKKGLKTVISSFVDVVGVQWC